MRVGAFLVFGLISLAPLASASGQRADQPPSCKLCGGANARPAPVDRRPLTIDVSAELDYAFLAHQGRGAGTVDIDARDGSRKITGGLVALNGQPMRGEVAIAGEPGEVIRITLPNRITLTASDGSSADIVNLTTDVGNTARLGSDGRLVFRFGGRLQVSAGTQGILRGRIAITADYP